MASIQNRIQRIGEIVGQLESTADPHVRALSQELLESVMAFHGAALERILEILSEVGETGKPLIAKCGHDELVGSLLLLYGLHPEDLEARVTGALKKSRVFLESHGARAELVSLREDGTVTVRLHVKSNGCGSSAGAVKSALEAAILNAAPDATSIVVEQRDTAAAQSGFVPVGELMKGKTLIGLHSGVAQGNGG
jgi:Fe-S cluster biogenesis protein NfuA